MELAKELSLYLEATPELYGQKLALVRELSAQPCTAAVVEAKFYDWVVGGIEQMSNELDLDPEDIEMSVCRQVARTYAAKLEAGAFKELDIMIREALESALRPGTKIQIRQDGKENSGRFGTIMEDALSEMQPTDPLVSEEVVKVRMDHNNQIDEVQINRLDVVESSTVFEPGADLLTAGPMDEHYTTDVEVEHAYNGLPPGVPEGSYMAHNQKVKIEWEMVTEARDWGIKGMSPIVKSGQEIEILFEEPTDDGDVEHRVKWKLGEVDTTIETPSELDHLSLQIMPISLHIDFSDNTAQVIFEIS